MGNNNSLTDQIRQTAAAVSVNEPMSKHTTFGVGGPAELFVRVSNTDQLRGVLSILAGARVPVLVFGRGSNLLVRDKGNAGSFVSSIGDRVSKVSAVSYDGKEHSFDRLQCGFDYRTSVFLSNKMIICRVQFDLEKTDPQKIKAKIDRVLLKKAAAQPLKEASAGCVFKNPKGQSAGELIEKAGLKGLSAGGARVSELHANYIVSSKGATAADVLSLMEKVQKAVEEKFFVRLEPEIRVVGD